MLKKEIKYTDLDGNPQVDVVYFNLTKAEAIELNIRNDLEVIGRSRNQNEIMDTFKRIITSSYGVRTGDGKFLKEERDAKVFLASEAYSELFMEIWQNPEYATEFIRGILPAEVSQAMGEQGNQSNIPAHLANHPSMQGHKQQAPQGPSGGSDAQPPTTPIRTLDNFNQTPAAQPPANSTDKEFLEFLEYKRHRDREQAAQQAAQTSPAPGVTMPEAPQSQPTVPRDELI